MNNRTVGTSFRFPKPSTLLAFALVVVAILLFGELRGRAMQEAELQASVRVLAETHGAFFLGQDDEWQRYLRTLDALRADHPHQRMVRMYVDEVQGMKKGQN